MIESKATPSSAKVSARSMSSSVVAWSRWMAMGTVACSASMSRASVGGKA